MSSNPAEWNLKVNLTGLREELARIPGITADEAKKMTVALAQQFKEAEKAAKAAAKANKDAGEAAKKAAKEAAEQARQWESSLRGVEKAGRIVGGPIGQITDLFGDLNDMIEGAGTGYGKLALGAGATAGALALVTGAAIGGYRAMDSLAASTTKAIERLRQIDGAEEPPLAVHDAIFQWEQATLRLEASNAKLTTQLATKFLPVAADAVDWVTSAAEGYGKAGTALEKWLDQLNDGSDAVAGIRGSWGLDTEIDAAGDAAGRSRPLLTDLTKITAELTDEELALGLAYGTIVDPVQEANERENERKTILGQVKDAAAELARTEAMRLSIIQGLGEQSEDRKIIDAYDAQLAAIDELYSRTGDLAEAEAMRHQALLDFGREQDALEAKRQKEAQEKADKQAKDAKQKADDEAKDAKQKADEADELARAQRDAHVEATRTIVGSVSDMTDAIMAGLDEGSAAYKAMFAVQKGSAIAGIAINTAEAITRANAEVPFPASVGVAAAYGVQGAVQAGIVAATGFTPKAHSGSSGIAPDEQVILKSESRGILAGLGMAAAGGPAGVAAMNRGEPPRGGVVRAQLVWRNRVMDGPISEMSKLPGTALYDVRRDGRRSGMRERPDRTRGR